MEAYWAKIKIPRHTLQLFHIFFYLEKNYFFLNIIIVGTIFGYSNISRKQEKYSRGDSREILKCIWSAGPAFYFPSAL